MNIELFVRVCVHICVGCMRRRYKKIYKNDDFQSCAATAVDASRHQRVKFFGNKVAMKQNRNKYISLFQPVFHI